MDILLHQIIALHEDTLLKEHDSPEYREALEQAISFATAWLQEMTRELDRLQYLTGYLNHTIAPGLEVEIQKNLNYLLERIERLDQHLDWLQVQQQL
jgi:hypothetical protein